MSLLGGYQALQTRVDILLVDEVLSVGDTHFKQTAERTMISKIQSQQTVVLVSHSHHQIERVCDRVILIEDGVSIATGDPREVLAIYNELMNTSKP